MIEEQANKLAAWLNGLMPTMTKPQLASVRDMLLERDDEPGLRDRLKAFVQSNDRFVISTFVAAIAPPAGPVETQLDRTQRELASAKAHAATVARQWAEIDAKIDDMSDVELARAVETAFCNLDVDMSHVIPSQRKRCYLPDGTVNRAGLTRLVKQEIVGLACETANP